MKELTRNNEKIDKNSLHEFIDKLDVDDTIKNELKNILGPDIKKVPFSINEVIGLSTGESRGIQPFSVFVDVVDTNINEGELARYQGQFSSTDLIQNLKSMMLEMNC